MRILHYTRLNPNGIGGVEKHISEIAPELRKLGHEIAVGTTFPVEWTSDEETPFFVHTHGDFLRNPLARTQKRPPNSRWVHIFHGTSLGRLLACREYASPAGWRGALREFAAGHLSDAVISVSENALHEVQKWFKIAKPSAVVTNGANPSIFRPIQAIAQVPRVFFAGRDDNMKNASGMLEACEKVAKRRSDFELWAAPGLKRERAMPYVRNQGPLDSAALAGKLEQCRALILVSHYEGDPVILREAQATGIPIIASNIAPHRESLRGYGNATLVDSHQVDDIARAIERVIEGNPPAPSPRLRSWADVACDYDAAYARFISQIR